MRLKYAYSLILIIIGLTNLNAQNNGGFLEFEDEKKPAPVIVQLNTKDSVFLKVESGQKYLLHKVLPGQNLYRIKQFYGVELSDLYYSNPILEKEGLKPGRYLKIPIVGRAIRKHTGKDFVDSSYVAVYYKVKKSDTMYGIAKRYFGIPIPILQHRNNLSTTSLSPKQVLHIGWVSKAGIPDSLRKYTGLTGVLGEENAKNKYKYEHLQGEKPELMKEGVARWFRGMDLAGKNKLYVMCSQVKAGNIVRIENPMTHRFLYAKVIGEVPENSATADAVVVLSPTVAQALGALDSRFFVNVRFYR
ncbi:MAG: LysM peptidoglycan-binding domain-containing protein [Aureispira sp.]|nr:LysM peptidoglycan-binding domain-containing protein [Aureispira sp.]